jgi:hypothetical protein
MNRTIPVLQSRFHNDRRAALTLLAENPDGRTRAMMLARGFSLALLNRLVRAGLVTAHVDRQERADELIEIVRVKITEAGRRALG